MGSSYFGQPNLGNERSRKGKKSNSHKPRQPQRGLGVAQLEEIRVNRQMASIHPTNLNQMGLGELERANIRYGDSQHSIHPRWNTCHTIIEAQQFAQPSITRPLLNLEVEDSLEKKEEKEQIDSKGSCSQNSESNGSQEIDLELRLSL